MLIQVVELSYDADARGADQASARRRIPLLWPGRHATPGETYAFIRFVHTEGLGFRETGPDEHRRPELKELGVVVTAQGVRILPDRPTWAAHGRTHQPSFEKAIPPGRWARYRHNARLPGRGRTLYFEWTVNVANPCPGTEPFSGDPAWDVDARVDLH